ncbi:MAG: hypothetical protein ACXW5W_22510, partial [Candidatus Binatia bacterium]
MDSNAQPQPKKRVGFGNLTTKSTKGAKEERCHFERREKSFLDLSHSLRMTGLWPVTSRPWRPWREIIRAFFCALGVPIALSTVEGCGHSFKRHYASTFSRAIDRH